MRDEDRKESFSIPFKAWFDSQHATMEAFARNIGTNRVSLRQWLNGRSFPRDEFCQKLYALTQLDCFGPGRDEARKHHELLIPPETRKERKAKYDAHADVCRQRAMASYHKRYEAQRQYVDTSELKALRKDPRLKKNVCRECGEILSDVGPHLGPAHDLTVDVYKAKWRFLRSRNATRSPETQAKQSAAMKKGKHRPPKWTRDLLPLAQKASLKTNVLGSARRERLLQMRGKVLGARPQFWKTTSDGDVVTDARIAQLRLRGMTLKRIAERVGMTIAPVFSRLRRMGFPRKARLFQHGEPVTGKSFVALVNDFDLTVEQAAERVSISVDWAGRLLRGKATERLSHDVARNVVTAREELLRLFRTKPPGGKGGRPKQLPAQDEIRLVKRYDRLQDDLKTLRTWIRAQERAPTFIAIWDQLCREFRSRRFRALQFSPGFFRWVEKNYIDPAFRAGNWIPFQVAREFVAFEFDVPEGFANYLLTHRQL